MAIATLPTSPPLTGATVYVLVNNAAGAVLYTVSATETSAGIYSANIPAALTPGLYTLIWYQQLGGSPSPTADSFIGFDDSYQQAAASVAPSTSLGNQLRIGSAWLDGMRDQYETDQVTYRRASDGLAISGLNATIGKTQGQVDTGDGTVLEFKSRDFLILVSALVIGGVSHVPATGDQITEADGTINEVAGESGTDEWDWADQFRTTYRVHTKQVKA